MLDIHFDAPDNLEADDLQICLNLDQITADIYFRAYSGFLSLKICGFLNFEVCVIGHMIGFSVLEQLVY